MGPKGLVGGCQGGEIEGGEFVLEIGGGLLVQKGLHVFMAEQKVHEAVRSFTGDGFLGAGGVEIECLEEVGGVSNEWVFYGLGFMGLFTGDGDEIVDVLHPLSWFNRDVFRGDHGIRGRWRLSLRPLSLRPLSLRPRPKQPVLHGQRCGHRGSLWL